jgi:hypothetical protein
LGIFSFLAKAACKTYIIYREKKMRASGFPTFQITMVALSSERSPGKMPGFKQDLQIWTHGWFLMYFNRHWVFA